jgi:hypothetical protein
MTTNKFGYRSKTHPTLTPEPFFVEIDGGDGS